MVRHIQYVLGLGLMGAFYSYSADIPLFEQFPQLKNALPYVKLGNWPTPVAQLHNLGKYLNINLYIKREDLCAQKFSGNKVRKLEFLLADAINHHKKSVICYGGVASNNVTATAVYCQQLGLDCIALLMHQPIVANLKRNLALDYYYGCKFFLCPQKRELAPDELQIFLRSHDLDEQPYIIPMGSSNKVGIIGWVNAVFELKQQIDQGLIPEPDYMYVSFGSMGTVAGILLGIKAAGLQTKVRAIQVTDPKKYTPEKLAAMIETTNDYLHAKDPAFAQFSWNVQDFSVNTNFFGGEFGRATPEGNVAEKLMFELENIILDESYTAKVIAALIHDAQAGMFKPTDTILYWHTYCSDEFTDILQRVDINQLPAEFQQYLK
jgi:1-aminocyclopropane-1-carboxylate deaminase/D-cysteine desulfhydrase-like pyridoxal-dependent ACC family enzyme